MGQFAERMAELGERVGDGKLTGSVVVDQVYAQYQHERLDLQHPQGGKAKYLYDPLVDNHPTYLQNIANDVLDSGPEEPMKRAMSNLSAEVFLNAPTELGDLRRSGSPRVYDGQALVSMTPPIQRRLTPSEMKAKLALRWALGLGHPNGRS